MSRIGLKIIPIPTGVKFEMNGEALKVTGPKGSLEFSLPNKISCEVKDNHIHFVRSDDKKSTKQIHGTIRALVNNAIVGVTKGYKKELIIKGTGYRAQLRGVNLVLMVGYSHEVVIVPELGVKLSCPDTTTVVVEGIDRRAVGEIAAEIRAVRKPEPYNGKGIMYKGEHIIHKEGKRAATAAKK